MRPSTRHGGCFRLEDIRAQVCSLRVNLLLRRNWATDEVLDGEPLCVMLPLLDMANHDAASTNVLLDSGGASVLVHGGDGIAEGQEVLF